MIQTKELWFIEELSRVDDWDATEIEQTYIPSVTDLVQYLGFEK